MFLSKVIDIPENIKKEINSILYKFIWNGNADKVCRDIFMQDFSKGEYNMHDFKVIDKAAKVIKYFYDTTNVLWKNYILEFTGVANLHILFRSNFDVYMIPGFSKLSNFYKEVIQNWKMIQYQHNVTKDEMISQWVWYNCKIFEDHLSQFFSKSLFQAGLWYIKDLFTENETVIPFHTWLKRGALPKDYLIWKKVVWTVNTRYEIIRTPIDNSHSGSPEHFIGIFVMNHYVHLNKMLLKDIKNLYTQRVFNGLKKEKRYKTVNQYNLQLGQVSDREWENIFLLPHTLPVENQIKEIQYKILLRYVPTNSLLYKMKKVNAPNCHICRTEVQTIEHLFYECLKAENL